MILLDQKGDERSFIIFISSSFLGGTIRNVRLIFRFLHRARRRGRAAINDSFKIQRITQIYSRCVNARRGKCEIFSGRNEGFAIKIFGPEMPIRHIRVVLTATGSTVPPSRGRIDK